MASPKRERFSLVIVNRSCMTGTIAGSRPRLGRLIGAHRFPVKPDAQVTLMAEKLEEVGRQFRQEPGCQRLQESAAQ